jgi:hypothetical protein
MRNLKKCSTNCLCLVKSTESGFIPSLRKKAIRIRIYVENTIKFEFLMERIYLASSLEMQH